MKGGFLSVFAAAVLSLTAAGQGVSYPEVVRKTFERADREILRRTQNDSQRNENRLNDNRRSESEKGLRLRVAIPDCEKAEVLREMVRIWGGEPVDMPQEGCSVIALRTASRTWDGALMPDDWVRADNEYSIIVYKTITDWNIPYLGVSPLTKTIDQGLKRLPCGISSIEELMRKARTYRKAVSIMDGIFSIDTHCDLPENYPKGWSVGTRTVSQAGVAKMDEGHLASQVLVSFLWQGPNDEA